MAKRLFKAALGFCVGVMTIPLAAIAYPFLISYYLYTENTEDYDII